TEQVYAGVVGVGALNQLSELALHGLPDSGHLARVDGSAGALGRTGDRGRNRRGGLSQGIISYVKTVLNEARQSSVVARGRLADLQEIGLSKSGWIVRGFYHPLAGGKLLLGDVEVAGRRIYRISQRVV